MTERELSRHVERMINEALEKERNRIGALVGALIEREMLNLQSSSYLNLFRLVKAIGEGSESL